MQGGKVMELGYNRSYSSPFRHPFWDEARPVPFISTMAPYAVSQGQKGVILSVKGTGFRPGAVVWLERRGLKTEFMSDTELRAHVPDDWLGTIGSLSVTVTTPEPSASLSNAVHLIVGYSDGKS
jgi:hypothetical protein